MGYCKSLVPAVDEHVEGFHDLLLYFLTPSVKLKLLRGYRTRFSKYVSKSWVVDATEELRKYVHQQDGSNAQMKLGIMRCLELPGDADDAEKDILDELSIRIAQSFVRYAKGIHPTMKSYGMGPARSTRAFKELPASLLALTYAVFYQACRTPPERVEEWMKKLRPHITTPWGIGIISRFVKLHTTFSKHRADVFAVYDKHGGKYMETETYRRKRKRKRNLEEENDEEDF